MITHIIWDFNGTVLDDVNMSVAAVNDMLTARGLATTSVEVYRDTLCMPLTDYYKTVGIYSDDIEALSAEFRACCDKHPELARVFEGVTKAVSEAGKLGIKSVVMSSLYHEHLVSEIERYGLCGVFDDLLGLPDKRLGSKYLNAKSYFEKNGIDAKSTLFLGDLTTDAQMAKQLGADCILIANGHMSKRVCKTECEKVFDNVYEVIEYIKRA